LCQSIVNTIELTVKHEIPAFDPSRHGGPP